MEWLLCMVFLSWLYGKLQRHCRCNYIYKVRFMNRRSRFVEDRSAVVRIMTGLIFLSVLLCCQGLFDESQVQVVTEPSAFKAFPLPPREVLYGPYSMLTADETAIIAWEEKEWTGKLRHVEVPFAGFAPSAKYFYSVNGSEQYGRISTAPTDNSPFSFLVWSDSRTGTEVATRIAAQMISLVPDASFALHAGDLVIDGDREESWKDEWWTPMHDLLLHCPIYPTMGNHEEDSEFYYRYFSSLGGRGTNYSFDWGTAHIVVCKIDEGDSEQLEWLEEDLAGNSNAGFTVVCHHVPPFSSTTSDTGGIPYLQDAVVPLFEKYGVDLVISGDVHSYQHHIRNNIHYLISAGGGETPYDYGLPLEGMTINLLKAYNFSRCRYENNTMYINTFNERGEAIDSFAIVPDMPPVITSKIVVKSSSSQVARGEQCRVDFFINNVKDLDAVKLTLTYYKDKPPVIVEVIDTDPLSKGVQIEQGEMGGTIQLNEADNSSGFLEYRENNLHGLNADEIKMASALFQVPEEAYITSMYLVPQVTLLDTSGAEIPHFMGGIKITITKE